MKQEKTKIKFWIWLSKKWAYWALVGFIMFANLPQTSGFEFTGSLIGSFVGGGLILALIFYPFYWYKYKRKGKNYIIEMKGGKKNENIYHRIERDKSSCF